MSVRFRHAQTRDGNQLVGKLDGHSFRRFWRLFRKNLNNGRHYRLWAIKSAIPNPKLPKRSLDRCMAWAPSMATPGAAKSSPFF